MSLATPLTGDLHPTIYPPSEDTYLLLDVLSSSSEFTFLSTHFPPHTPAPLVLELGPGSGTITSFLTTNSTSIFGHSNILTLGMDANLHACLATAETVRLNHSPTPGVFLGAIQGDLGGCIRAGTVDVIVFNPPYVPSESVPPPAAAEEQQESEREREERLLALTYDGGVDGMEVTARVLDSLELWLSSCGVAYILFCNQNRPEQVVGEWLEERNGGEGIGAWEAECVGKSGKRGGMERLSVWRIWRLDGGDA